MATLKPIIINTCPASEEDKLLEVYPKKRKPIRKVNEALQERNG